jgi:hypothetical protein
MSELFSLARRLELRGKSRVNQLLWCKGLDLNRYDLSDDRPLTRLAFRSILPLGGLGHPFFRAAPKPGFVMADKDTR